MQNDLNERGLKTLLSSAARSVMVLGGPDTGKTSLASTIAGLLSRDAPVAVLDLDMGQAHIGPPSAISWGIVEGGFRGWEVVRPEGLYFTGALSPPGNMLPSLAGAALLLEAAAARCPRVVIDTTGLIAGPVGRLYKQYKIDLLRPDVLLAIEKDGELEHIISPYRAMKTPAIMRIRPSMYARSKSIPLRTGFRAERFRRYFEGSSIFEVDLNKCAVRYTRDDHDDELTSRLLSFRDETGSDICLGVVEKAAPEKGLLLVRSPLKPGTGYACVVIGRATAVF